MFHILPACTVHSMETLQLPSRRQTQPADAMRCAEVLFSRRSTSSTDIVPSSTLALETHRALGRVSNPSASSDDDAMFSTMVMATRGSGRPATAAACTAMLTSCGAPVRYGSVHASTTGGRRRRGAGGAGGGAEALPPAALALAGRQASASSSEAGMGMYDHIFGRSSSGDLPTPRSMARADNSQTLTATHGMDGGCQPSVPDDVPQHRDHSAGEHLRAEPAASSCPFPRRPRASSTATASSDPSEASHGSHHAGEMATEASSASESSSVRTATMPSDAEANARHSPARGSPDPPQCSTEGPHTATPEDPEISETGRSHDGREAGTGVEAPRPGSARARSVSPSSSLQHLKEVRQRQQAREALQRSCSSGDVLREPSHSPCGREAVPRSHSSPSPPDMHALAATELRGGVNASTGAAELGSVQLSEDASDAGVCRTPQGQVEGSEALVDAMLAAQESGKAMHADADAGNGLSMHVSPLPAPFPEQQLQATLRSETPSAAPTVTQRSSTARSAAEVDGSVCSAGNGGAEVCQRMHASPSLPPFPQRQPQPTLRSAPPSAAGTETQRGSTARSATDVDGSTCGASDTGSMAGVRWHSPSSTGAPALQAMAYSDTEEAGTPRSATASAAGSSRRGAGDARHAAGTSAASPAATVGDGGERGTDLTALSSSIAPTRRQAVGSTRPPTAHGQGLRARRRRHSGSAASADRSSTDLTPAMEPEHSEGLAAQPPQAPSPHLGVSRSGSVRSVRTAGSSQVSVGLESTLSEAGMEPPRELDLHDELLSPEESCGHSEASMRTANTALTAAHSAQTGVNSRAHTVPPSAELTPACSIRSEPHGEGADGVRGPAGGWGPSVDPRGPWKIDGGAWVAADESGDGALQVKRVGTCGTIAGHGEASGIDAGCGTKVEGSLQAAAAAMLQDTVEACVHAPSLQLLASTEQPATAPPPPTPAAAVCRPAEAVNATSSAAPVLQDKGDRLRLPRVPDHLRTPSAELSGLTNEGDLAASDPHNDHAGASTVHSGHTVPAAFTPPDEHPVAAGSEVHGGAAEIAGLLQAADDVTGAGSQLADVSAASRAVFAGGRRVTDELNEARHFWVPDYSSGGSSSGCGSARAGTTHNGDAGPRGDASVQAGDRTSCAEVHTDEVDACVTDDDTLAAGGGSARSSDARGLEADGAGSGVDVSTTVDAPTAVLGAARGDPVSKGEAGGGLHEGGVTGRGPGVRFAADRQVDEGGTGGGASLEGSTGNTLRSAAWNAHLSQSCSLFGDHCMSEWSLDSGALRADSCQSRGAHACLWLV